MGRYVDRPDIKVDWLEKYLEDLGVGVKDGISDSMVGASSKYNIPQSDYYKQQKLIHDKVMRKTFTERIGSAFPMSGLLALPVFAFLFLLIVISPAITYFIGNKDNFVIDDGVSTSFGSPILTYDDLSAYAEYIGVDTISDLDLSSADAFYTQIKGYTFNDLLFAWNVPLLTFTNLIQNGQFSSNINEFITFAGSPSWENGMAKFFGITSQILGQNISFSVSDKIYIRFDYITSRYVSGRIGATSRYGGTPDDTFYSPQSASSGTFSGIETVAQNINQIWFGTQFSANADTLLDNLIVFNPSNYTKTQINSAIDYYGYPEYNVTKYWYDVTDPNWQYLHDLYYSGEYELFLEYYDAVDLDGYDVPDPNHELFYAYGLDDVTKLYLDEGTFNLTNYYWVNPLHYRVLGVQVVNGLKSAFGSGSFFDIASNIVSKSMNFILQSTPTQEVPDYANIEDLDNDGFITFWEKLVSAIAMGFNTNHQEEIMILPPIQLVLEKILGTGYTQQNVMEFIAICLFVLGVILLLPKKGSKH